ncbi:claspin-like [Diadema antillarum]|uniref:claspin-like n=1 Tax=Diadema antillarum TaxID=105358 RepID=UPI003A8BE9F3
MLGVEAAPHIMETGSLFNSDVFDADDDSDEEDQIVRTLKPKQSKATKSLRLIMSDDDDESDSDGLHSLSDAVEQSSEETRNDEDSRTTPSATPGDERKEIRTEPPRGHGGGEEEGEEDDSIPDSDDGKEDDNNSDSSDSDDGIDEEEEIAFQLSPFPEAEQVEGGNSDERSMRRRRVRKADLQQIHSESQRIVRESSISIPYHKPKPLSLDELFNKKPSPSKLKPIRGRVPRLKAMSKTMAAMQQEKPTKEQKKQESDDELPDMLSGHVQKIAEETKDTLKDSGAETLSKDSQQPSCENGDKVAGEECAAASSSPAREDGTKKSEECAEEKMLTPATTDVENDRMDCSSPGSQEKPKTTPPPPRPAESALSRDDAGAEDAPTFKVPSTASPSLPPTPSSSQSRRMQLLQESLKKLKGLKPKLSGGPQATIDLDEGAEPTAEEKGVAKLMKRFVKHTAHVKPTQVKEVQINVVTKEKGEDGKEDLKHHSICVGLDPTQEELDPALKIPGAKLVHLKENLQAQMKVRRESERQKRQEMFQLDNEEGFAGDDEDDAELTEGSDTEEEEADEDDGVMNMGNVDDDEEDEDYKVENEFVDDEAESDDDDDEEEEGNEDEEGEEDDNLPRTKSKQKARKSEKDSAFESDEEISPSRKGRTKKRAMVVEDEDEDDNCDGNVPEDKPMTLRLESIDTDDTDAELTDCLQDSGKFMSGSLVRTPGTALDHSSKTMEMFDSGTNSTVTSDFQVPRKVDSSSKRVSWNAGKDTDSSKDSTGFALPIPVRQDSSSNSMDTSFEAITSLIPAHQPEGGMRKSGRASVDSTKEGFIPFSKHQSFLGDLSKSMTRTDLSLPVEDSQDLFREDSPRLPTITDSQQVGESQSFHFSFEDETQTQFLDENGLLNLKPSSRKSQSSKPATLFSSTQAHSSESQPGMEELLGLCSGQFTETQAKDESDDDKPGPFSQVSQGKGTQANMDELLDLCSGTFTGVESRSQNIPSLHVKDPALKKEDDDEADADEASSTVSFHIASDPEGSDSDDDDENERGFSSDEDSPRKSKCGDDDDDDSEEEEDDDDGEVEKGGEKEADAKDDEDGENSDVDSEFAFEAKSGRFKGHTYGKPLKLANFVDEEAELSGSEMGSDEDYDAEDEPDDEELEGIINEEMGDEDELRNQVNKVHMKTMDDDDARRLRIYKEMYLPDGDLYSENKGRTRRFRWKHLDSQMDMFQPASDGEEEEEDVQQDQDSQWRLQRYQREQWLKEKEKPTEVTPNDILTVDEHSQFAKCLRTATCRKPRAETPTQEVQEKEKEKEKKVGTPKPLKIMTKRGSFLNRSKNDLEKMASMLKPLANPKGPRNNRNFVFQSAEAVMNEDSNTASEPPKVKRSASVSGPSSKHTGPDAKRPRIERSQSQFTQNSVFRHF